MNTNEILQRQLQMIGYPKSDSLASFDSISSSEFIDLILFLFSKIPSTANKLSEPPKSHSALFKYTTQIVALISSLGYTDDLRYDNFMYPKGEKVRSVLRFMLEKVPKAESATGKTSANISPMSMAILSAISSFNEVQKTKKEKRELIAQPFPLLDNNISAETKEEINNTLKQKKVSFLGIPILNNGISFGEQCGINSFASLLARNDHENDFNSFEEKSVEDIENGASRNLKKISKRAFGSVLTTHEHISVATAQTTAAAPSAKMKSRLENIARFEFSTSDTKIGASVVIPQTIKEEQLVERKTDDIKEVEENKEPKLTSEQVKAIKAEQQEELQETVDLLHLTEQKVTELEESIENEKEELTNITVSLNQILQENEKLEAEAERSKGIAAVSKSDKSQIEQLKKDLINNTSELLEIANQYEPKRVKLLNEYRSLASTLKQKQEDRQLQMTKLSKLKRQIQEGEEKLQNFDLSINELTAALEARGEQLHRNHYSNIIFDMIKKIRKQEIEVEKVRNDIIDQHQRMNQTIETVKRTWLLLDETIYSSAKTKKEEWMRKSYGMVVELLTLFESISENVEISGSLSAQAMELESKIERIQQQNDPKALQRILNDLKEVQEEIKSYENK